MRKRLRRSSTASTRWRVRRRSAARNAFGGPRQRHGVTPGADHDAIRGTSSRQLTRRSRCARHGRCGGLDEGVRPTTKKDRLSAVPSSHAEAAGLRLCHALGRPSGHFGAGHQLLRRLWPQRRIKRRRCVQRWHLETKSLGRRQARLSELLRRSSRGGLRKTPLPPR